MAALKKKKQKQPPCGVDGIQIPAALVADQRSTSTPHRRCLPGWIFQLTNMQHCISIIKAFKQR